VCLHLLSILLFPSFYGPRWLTDSDELTEEEAADGTCHSSASANSGAGTGYALSRVSTTVSHKSYMTLPSSSSATDSHPPAVALPEDGDIELQHSPSPKHPLSLRPSPSPSTQSYHHLSSDTSRLDLDEDPLVSSATVPSSPSSDFISFYQRHVPLKETVTMWRCYALMTAFMCIAGSGLLVINNIQAIVQALHQEASPLFVTILSLANACGRLTVGVIGDYFQQSISRLQLLALIALSMAFAQYLLSLGSIALLYPCLLLVGFMFGACFSNTAAVTADIFGSKFIGSNYGFIDLAPAVGSYVFSTALIALFYRPSEPEDSSPSSSTPSPSSSSTCYGETCFRTSFRITTLCCLLSAGLALWTNHHTRIVKKIH
jgi:hypothetical protein